MHFSWGAAETRRDVVSRLARRVKAWTLERRIAFLPGGWFAHVPGVARSEARAIRAVPRLRMMTMMVVRLGGGGGGSYRITVVGELSSERWLKAL
jgi:hypothetical protein